MARNDPTQEHQHPDKENPLKEREKKYKKEKNTKTE